MCPSWSTCKAGACGEDSQNLADRLQLHCGGGGKQDLAASTRARQPIPGHHHQLDDPWQHGFFYTWNSVLMARKKAHLVRNILLLTASSWWTFSAAWRRWLEPWCKAGAANVKAAPESAGGPGLSGLLLGAHFGLLCNRAPAPPPWCSAARRDVLQRITERSLLLPCG